MLHNTIRKSFVCVTIMGLVFGDGSVSSNRKMHSTPDHWSCVSLKTLAIFSSDHTLHNVIIVPPWLLDNKCSCFSWILTDLTSVSLSYLTVLTAFCRVTCDTSENVRNDKDRSVFTRIHKIHHTGRPNEPNWVNKCSFNWMAESLKKYSFL